MKERYDVSGSFGKVDLALLPPCMQHILGELQRGENAAHNARFAIATFLHKIGMTSEDTFSYGGSYATSNMSTMHSAGVTLLRQTFNWHDIELSPGNYDFSLMMPALRS